MALFKILKGTSANLGASGSTNSKVTHEGWCYFTTDTKKLYIDLTNNQTPSSTNRVALNAALADNVTGVVAITNGGTGSTSAANARTALGLGSAATQNSTAFALASHTHNYAAASHTHNYAAASHTHNYAAVSHGNHVPATLTANNAIFLRNDNSWATVTPANIGAVATTATIDIAHGGTGSTSAANARTALGLGSAATLNSTAFALASHTHSYVSTTATIDIAHGGTGATSAANARTALGLGTAATAASTAFAAASHTHNYAANVYATTSLTGLVKLVNSYTSTSTSLVATANNVASAAKLTSSANTTSKIFILGAGSQSSSAVTPYSNLYVYTTANTFSAGTIGINNNSDANKVILQYNSTDQSLDFIFS